MFACSQIWMSFSVLPYQLTQHKRTTSPRHISSRKPLVYWPLTICFCFASFNRRNTSANITFYPFCYGNYLANKLRLASCYLSSPFGLWHHTSEESLSLESRTPPDSDEHWSTYQGPAVLWCEWRGLNANSSTLSSSKGQHWLTGCVNLAAFQSSLIRSLLDRNGKRVKNIWSVNAGMCHSCL